MQISIKYSNSITLNVAKCNLGKVKKETMIVSGHIRKYVGGSQPLSESCQRGLSLTCLRALQGIVSLCSCLCVDTPTIANYNAVQVDNSILFAKGIKATDRIYVTTMLRLSVILTITATDNWA